jgi:hypothetical protein
MGNLLIEQFAGIACDDLRICFRFLVEGIRVGASPFTFNSVFCRHIRSTALKDDKLLISRPWRDFAHMFPFPALASRRAGLLSFAPAALVSRSISFRVRRKL